MGFVPSWRFLAFDFGTDHFHLAEKQVRQFTTFALHHLGFHRVVFKSGDCAIEWPIFIGITMDSALTSLFSSSLGVDIALAFIAIEFAYLLLGGGRKASTSKTFELMLALGPGVCIMLALRCALTGTGAIWIAVWLAASLPLHLADVVRRKL